MNRREFVKAAACILMLIVFAATGWAADIEVSQPVQVTDSGYYERGQSIVYDGADYWLFYGRSASCTDPYSSGDPDLNDYELYYKKAGTVAELAAATALAVQVGGTPVTDSYMGETAAAYMDSKVWVFATIDDGVGHTDLYGYYTSDGGSTWTQVGPHVAGMSTGQGHHDAVVFDGELWLLEGSGDFHTMHSSTPTNTSSFSTPLQVGGMTGGLGHFFVDGTSLYLALGSAGTYYIYAYNSGSTAWDLVDSKVISGYYDPTLYKVGSDYVFHCAPYAGGRQWIVGWAGSTLDGTFFDGTEVAVIDGQYGSNVWVDMWPIGYTHGGTSYLFFSSERDDPAAEGTGNIWYTEVDWNVYNSHYTYIQEAINGAIPNDDIYVADGIYGADPATGKALYITTDGLSLIGESEAGTIIDGAVGGVGSSGAYWPKGIHVQANNVTVQNFTVKGFMGDLVSSGGYAVLHRDYDHDTPTEGFIFYDGCTVDNVTVQNSCYCIYALCFTHLTVSDCTVSDNAGDGMFIARGCDYANIHNNVVTNSGDHGIWVGNCFNGLAPSDNATITNNTINGAREGGISFVGSDGAVIEGNVITNAAGDGWSVGALSLKDGASNVVARHNTIYGNNGAWNGYAGTGHGIGIDGTPSNITLSCNSVYGNTGDGCHNYSTVDVDASANWWGSTDPTAVAGAMYGPVDYTPWLASGTDTSTDPGFQGDYSVLWVDDDSPQMGTSNRIQEGVDLVSGSTLRIANGTYNATTSNSTEWLGHAGEWWFVTVDKSLDIIGESRDGVVLDGTALQTENRCTGIWVSANNVAVKNLTLQGFTQSPVTAACYAMYVMEQFRNYTWDDVGVLEYVTAENLRLSGNMYATYFMKTEHATVSNCISENNLGDGIWVAWGSHHATVEGSTITNAGDHGIWVGAAGWTGNPTGSNSATITNNTINGAREGGISFVGSDGAVIEGNVITNAAGEGWSVGALSLKDGVSNVVARYNTIYGNDGAWNGYAGTGHGIGIDGTPSNITLSWNSIYGNAGDGCHNYSTVDVDATHNWWGAADGPGGSGPGSGDEVSPYVPYDPWIGETGSENIVCVADPTYLDAGTPTKAIAVNYLGGGGGLMYAYTVKFTWNDAIVSTAFGSVSEETLLSDDGTTFFSARSTGTNEITVDCALLGSEPGVTGPGTMFTIAFTGQNVGTSDIDVTIIKVKDQYNALLGGFYADNGLLIVDVSVPTITGVEIFNTTLTHTDAYIKDTDGAQVTATVIDDDPLFSAGNITANLLGLGGGAADIPGNYDAVTKLATWTIVAPTGVTCDPANGDVWVYVDATDAIGNGATQGSDKIIADNTAPTPVTNFDAVPGHQKCDLSWTMGADSYLAGVVVQRNDNTGDYPLYTAFKGVWPNVVGFYPGSELVGTNVYDGTGTGTADAVVDRNIYYYQAFCYDIARNYGAAEVAGASADLATNYWLGDIAAAWTVWGYNGLVNDADIDKLGGCYGTINEVECDVGPTVHPEWHRLGLPTPDGIVEFEDLMIFAMNYGVVSARAVPLLTEPAVGDLALSIEEIGRSADGTVELALRLEGNIDEVKGVTAALSLDGLEFVSARLSDEMETPAADIFFWHGERDGAVQIDLAMLGTGMTIGGSGELVHLTFQAAGDAYSVEFESASLRGAENGDLDADLAGFGSGDEIPAMFRLVQNAPNPFNPLTTIAYEVPQASAVTITVYDVSGRLVTTLVDGAVDPGRHSVIWDGRNDCGESVGSGVYFCVMETPDYRGSHKMTLLK